MARTSITATDLVSNGSVTDPTGTATGTGDGNGVVVDGQPFLERLHLRVENSGGAAATVSVKAGSGVAAISAGQGDLTVSVAAGATAWVGPFESARFQADDGSLAVDASAAVTVTAFQGSRV
ncbi:hypothetical protein Csp2054_14270 [Curtobacterium sp. 'Ferrero']|uniref:hypothetical protein n=1 Tax=Curtobacterium sp. 'Ferrero' TaxID=2033654 RepID=UPI000BDD10B0|nr:hypothetical protein [Curtobacterium sp. 'Ferrero']PCN47004.1 hypothetical protein Csp2054_14270 [Curtobacterium sp. 'Ferrero']